jgi:hypothetical protein
MKKLLCIILIHAFFIGKSQNLVPNWSFEDTIKCIQHDGQFIGYVSNWTGQSTSGGLSYFTSHCSGVGYDAGVPYNIVGFQYALTGVSYAGIYSYINDTVTDTSYHDTRNYLEVMLVTPLKSLVKYYATFYVNCANTNNYSCSDMGAYLSDSALVFSVYDRPKYKLTPQITNSSVLDTLKDTLNWIKISGTYIANGGEQYIIIGNFKPDSLSHIRYLGNRGNPGAYYYVDDVIVTTDSNYADSVMAVNELRTKSEEVSVYPNPGNGVFTVSIKNEKLKIKNLVEVYNMLGEKVYSNPFITQNSKFKIDITGNPAGVYLYRITDEEGNLVSTGKLIID